MTDIVVGVDGSTGAADALMWSMREAALHRWSVTAVLAWGFLDQHHMGTATFDPQYTEADAARALDHYIETAVGDSSQIKRKVVCDLAPRALLAESSDAQLLVVGARGLGGFKGLLVGSVSQHCLQRSQRPVAIIHGTSEDENRTSERIVVGIDGSETAAAALDWAREEAVLRGAVLEVVHAWQLPYMGGHPYPAYDPAPIEHLARKILDDAVDALTDRAPAPPVQRTLVSGGAAMAILTAAKDAALAVVGSRGVGGFKGLLLGSVSHQVAIHARCPIIIVPSPTEGAT